MVVSPSHSGRFECTVWSVVDPLGLGSMSVSHWWLTAVAGFLLLAARPGIAHGQGASGVAREPTAVEVRQAAELFDQGRAAFKEGRFIEAAEHFEAADARAPSAVTLGLAMRCRAQAGQLAKSATLAAHAVRRYPTDVDLVSQASAIVAEAAGATGKIELHCDPACEVLVDRKIVHGAGTTDWELYVEPGAHDISISWAELPVRTEHIEVEAGGQRVLSVVPVAAPPGGATRPLVQGPIQDGRQPGDNGLADGTGGSGPTSTLRRWSPIPFWVGVGVTGVAAVATTWSGIDTLNNPGKDKVREDCAGKGTDCPTYQEAQGKELRTNVLLISTGVLALATTAVGLFVTDWSGGSRPSATAAGGTRQGSSRRATTREGDAVTVAPWLDSSMGVEDLGSRRYHIVVGTTGRF